MTLETELKGGQGVCWVIPPGPPLNKSRATSILYMLRLLKALKERINFFKKKKIGNHSLKLNRRYVVLDNSFLYCYLHFVGKMSLKISSYACPFWQLNSTLYADFKAMLVL